MKNIAGIKLRKTDFILLVTMTILICVGLYCTRQAFRTNDEQDSTLIKQFAGILIGYVMITGIIFIDYHMICTGSFALYVIMIAVLAATLLAPEINHVNRWIILFGLTIQPSEFTKVVLILFLAFLCGHFKDKLNKMYVLFLLTAVVALPVVLILLEPHLSSCVAILFVFCIMIYCSSISYKVIGKAILLILPAVAILLIGVSVFDVNIPFIEKYHVNRVLSFVSTDESDNLSGDYQQIQSIGAIASGGIHGKMIASDSAEDREYRSIYAKESDFIFSIIGEEFGFIGSLMIILLYGVLVARCLIISSRASDEMGRLICAGVSAYFMFQVFVNIGVATKILPNTGLPLPFISNGLSSLISSMAAVGLVLNIGLRQRRT